MIRMGILACSLLLILGFGIFAAESKQSAAQLLFVGTFHGDETTAKTGEVWWGLYPKGTGYFLKKVTLKVKTVQDIVTDNPEGPSTGKAVSTVEEPTQEPVMLVQGIPRLKTGKVTTVYHGLAFIRPGEEKKLPLGNKPYRLAAQGTLDPKKQRILDYHLSLTLGNRSQVLHTSDEEAEIQHPLVLWAGDLNQDGQLDLLMNVSQYYNLEDYQLFLSSPQSTGPLLQPIAGFKTTGC